MAGHPTFEESWKDLSRRLDATLTRRGLPPWLKDDILQETGLRLYKVWDALDHQRPLLPLAYTIARNLVADEVRRNRNVDIEDEIEEASDEHITERAGLARLELHQVEAALSSLTEKQRSVLLADLGVGPPPKMGPDAIKMARMRARRSLLALLAGASRLHSGMVFNYKRVVRSIEVASSSQDGWGLAAGTLVAAAMIMSTWTGPPPWTPVAPPGPAVIAVDGGPAGVGAGSFASPAPVEGSSVKTSSSASRGDAAKKGSARGNPDGPEETTPPTITVGGSEASAGAGVRVLGNGAQAGSEGEDEVVVCLDHDRFRVGFIGDSGCSGTLVGAEGGWEIQP